MKKIILFTFVFLCMLTTQAFAHTGLLSSNPEDGSTVTEPLSEITLTFETVIEQTSSFELQNGSGETILVEDIAISEDTMTGTVSEPLENDNYTAYWEIIGADGHAMQGEFSFKVNAPVSETAPEEDQVAAESDTADSSETETDSADVQEEGSNTLMIGIIIVIIVVIAAIILIRRKK